MKRRKTILYAIWAEAPGRRFVQFIAKRKVKAFRRANGLVNQNHRRVQVIRCVYSKDGFAERDLQGWRFN